MKIGIIQHRCEKDIAKNIEHIEHGIRKAAQQGAQLVVLQELLQKPNKLTLTPTILAL